MSIWRRIAGRWGDGVSEVADIRIDPSTHALENISVEHSEVHGGSAYVIKSYVDLAINNVYDIQITTPDTTEWSHMTFLFSCESETLWEVYENVVIVTPGTTITPGNRNRNSANTSGLIFKGILNTSTANANSDTTVAAATLLADGIIGSGKQEGGTGHSENEVALKQNEDYTVRFTASAAGYTNYHLDWYDHTDRN